MKYGKKPWLGRKNYENFNPRVPFLTFALPAVIRPKLFGGLDNLLISPLLVSPWLVVVLAGGLMLPRGRERWLLPLCAVPFAVEVLLILGRLLLAGIPVYDRVPSFGRVVLGGVPALGRSEDRGGPAHLSRELRGLRDALCGGDDDVAIPLPEPVVGVPARVPPEGLAHFRGARFATRARLSRALIAALWCSTDRLATSRGSDVLRRLLGATCADILGRDACRPISRTRRLSGCFAGRTSPAIF